MRKLVTVLPAALLALFGATVVVHGQIKTGGEVVELIDAKTVIVAAPAGRIRVELEYIDVPEPMQALHRVVKEHVGRMLVGRTVELHTRGFTSEKATGKLVLNGVDVGQQLIRDGAAWHVPIEMSGQSRAEFDLYAESESLARNEKRGVWSVAGLKPPWQVRAENEEMRRQAEASARRGRSTSVGVTQFHTDNRGGSHSNGGVSTRAQMNAWLDVFSHGAKEGYGLHTHNDPNGRGTAVYTSAALIEFTGPGGDEKIDCRAIYVTINFPTGERRSALLLAFVAMSEKYRFSTGSSRMTVSVDKKSLALGAPFGYRGQGLMGGGEIGSTELMYFMISRSTLLKMADSNSTQFRIDRLTGSLPKETKALFRQLAAAVQ